MPTQGFKGAHYATFPITLPRKLINLMCPRRVCRECGEPRRRIVEAGYVTDRGEPAEAGTWASGIADGKGAHAGKNNGPNGRQVMVLNNQTLGWTDCGHDTWRRGIVLDPFAGSGTTLLAAAETGRDSIGIDLDARNLDLARERLGMFLVEDDEPAAVG